VAEMAEILILAIFAMCLILKEHAGKHKQIKFRSYFENFENRRRDVISLNQPRGMSAKMAANGIPTHARTNESHTLA